MSHQASKWQGCLTILLSLYHRHDDMLAHVEGNSTDDGIQESSTSDSEIVVPGERPQILQHNAS
jgi:hypothetical protein